jgi:hypothetical protein
MSPVTVVIPDIIIYCYWVFYGSLVVASGLLNLVKHGESRSEPYHFGYWVGGFLISLPIYLRVLEVI